MMKKEEPIRTPAKPLGARLVTIAVAVGLFLLIPLIAMQLSDEVNWSTIDFVTVGLLLLAAGVSYELLVPKISNPVRRRMVIAAIVGLVLLIWAELAVGVIGTPFAGS